MRRVTLGNNGHPGSMSPLRGEQSPGIEHSMNFFQNEKLINFRKDKEKTDEDSLNKWRRF